jgi:hypothetical protein
VLEAPKATVETLLSQALSLAPHDKARLIERLSAALARELLMSGRQPLQSMRGILKGYGPAPSAEEIDEARREMWANFPRDDIA